MKIQACNISQNLIRNFLVLSSLTLFVGGILAAFYSPFVTTIEVSFLFLSSVVFICLAVCCTKKSSVIPLKKEPLQDTSLCGKTIFNCNPPEELSLFHNRAKMFFLNKGDLKPFEERALGVMLGGMVGDALCSPLEFLDYNKKGYSRQSQGGHHSDAGEIDMDPKKGYVGFAQMENRFRLMPGQWTDDGSMMNCLGDSLILNGGLYSGTLTMRLYQDWWYRGFNNAFRKKPRPSVGLGGNISVSLRNFPDELRGKRQGYKTPKTKERFTSGNGSLMREGPISLVATSAKEATEMSKEQSYSTHEGREAAECCMVMSKIIYLFIHEDDFEKRKAILGNLEEHFTEFDLLPSTWGLIRSQKNVPNFLNSKEKENWNWKDKNFAFNPKRIAQKPDYVGSYAMDALAMALHALYTEDCFEQSIRKVGSQGGDSDSVAAIAGQLAGAYYGVSQIPRRWIDAVHLWDNGETAGRALALLNIRQSRLSCQAPPAWCSVLASRFDQ